MDTRREITPFPAVSATDILHRVINYGYDWRESKIPQSLVDKGVVEITPPTYTKNTVRLKIGNVPGRFGETVCDCEVVDTPNGGTLYYRIRLAPHSFIISIIIFWALAAVAFLAFEYHKGMLRLHWLAALAAVGMAVLHPVFRLWSQSVYVRTFGPGIEQALQIALTDAESKYRR